MRFVGVFNRDGGTFRTTDMEPFCSDAVSAFSEFGHELTCRVVDGEDLEVELERAARDIDHDAVLAGGGDGTISAAASACFAHGMPLAVLPAGTMNLFARSLGVPLQLDAALRALAGGTIGAVDIATANGRPFVHQFSVGMHSRLVRLRNGLQYRSRWGKILASLRAVVVALSRPLVFDAVTVAAQERKRWRATAIAVSNNPLGEGHVPYAERVDRGVLGVYVVEPMPPAELAKLAFSLAFGNWKAHPLLSQKEVSQLELSFPRRKAGAQAVIDGELIPLERAVDLQIYAGGLRVVVPATEGSVSLPTSSGAVPAQ